MATRNKSKQHRPAPAAPPRRKVNHCAVLFDRSGSMIGKGPLAMRAANDLLKSIREAGEATGQINRVTTYYLNHDLVPIVVDSLTIPYLTGYPIGGGTALATGFIRAVNELKSRRIDPADDNAYVIHVITDGQDEDSPAWDRSNWPAVVRELVSSGVWTVAFSGPPGMKRDLARFGVPEGIPEGNLQEWEATEKGIETLRQATVTAYQAYATNRSIDNVKGSTTEFFTANVTFTPDEMRAKLEDLTHRVKAWKVDKEATTKEVVEQHGWKFYLGATYYLLMKDEKVQADKQVIVEEKNTKKYYGGSRARALLGLPDGKDAKVRVGDMGNFNVYVQSRSINRKVPRGTTLLLRTDQTADLQPTWDHVKAEEEALKKKLAQATI